MGFCGLVRRKRVQKHKSEEKASYGDEKPKHTSQAAHPTFAAHQRQRQHLGPRPVVDTRNSNFSQASTLDTPATPPPLYQSRPHSPHREPSFLPLIKQHSPFRGIPEITVSSQRPGSSTSSNTYPNSTYPSFIAQNVDSPPPMLRIKLASRPESYDSNSRPVSLRPSTASVVDSTMSNNSSPRASLDPPAPAIRYQPTNRSSDSDGRLSPAPPIPRVSSKRNRPNSIPVTTRGGPHARRQSPGSIARKPISHAPSIPPLPSFAGLGSLRAPPSQSGMHRSDTVASRYDHEGIREEDDDDWVPPVPGLDMDAYLGLVGESPYEVDEPEAASQKTSEVLPSRGLSYRRGCAPSMTKGPNAEAPAVRVGGFGGEDSRSREREFEDGFRARQLEGLTDVPVINVVSAGGSFDERAQRSEAMQNDEKKKSTPAPLKVMRSSGLIVDVPVLNQAPRPPTKQERQERRNASGAGGRW